MYKLCLNGPVAEFNTLTVSSDYASNSHIISLNEGLSFIPHVDLHNLMEGNMPLRIICVFHSEVLTPVYIYSISFGDNINMECYYDNRKY